MTEEQRDLLRRLKSTIPPDDPHVYTYLDTNQLRWEMLISLLETMLGDETVPATVPVEQADPESYPQARKTEARVRPQGQNL